MPRSLCGLDAIAFLGNRFAEGVDLISQEALSRIRGKRESEGMRSHLHKEGCPERGSKGARARGWRRTRRTGE
eukprot:5193194-Pleurochrysis_carterae.AAC.2